MNTLGKKAWNHGLASDPMTRFAPKVERVESGCWIWRAARLSAGYGLFYWNKKYGRAHIYSFETFRFKVPEGLELDHLCRNPLCVNPFHLEAVTHRINMLRGSGAAARNAKKTHCPRGHPYSPENTIPHIVRGKYIGRVCKICKHAYDKQYNAKYQAARKQAAR